MTMKKALQKAKEAASMPCCLTAHYGRAKKDKAVRITGTDKIGADTVGAEIEAAISGAYRYAAGFACVWFD